MVLCNAVQSFLLIPLCSDLGEGIVVDYQVAGDLKTLYLLVENDDKRKTYSITDLDKYGSATRKVRCMLISELKFIIFQTLVTFAPKDRVISFTSSLQGYLLFATDEFPSNLIVVRLDPFMYFFFLLPC